jgi:hypothetical protein
VLANIRCSLLHVPPSTGTVSVRCEMRVAYTGKSDAMVPKRGCGVHFFAWPSPVAEIMWTRELFGVWNVTQIGVMPCQTVRSALPNTKYTSYQQIGRHAQRGSRSRRGAYIARSGEECGGGGSQWCLFLELTPS